jgi:hypothetical protein
MSDTPNPFGTNQPNNPFQAPSAAVADVRQNSASRLIEGGRSVPAGNAVAWYSSAWKLFTANPLIWIVMAVIGFVLIMVLSLIPIIGMFVGLLMVFLFAGVSKGCNAIENGETLEIGHMFAGFSEKGGPLAILGVLYLVGSFIVTGIAVLMMFVIGGTAAAAGLFGAFSGDAAASAALFTGGVGLSILLVFLVMMALFIPLFMMIWLSPTLIMLHDYDAIKAAKESFFACLKNFVPFLLYGVLYVVLAIVATIPLGLGWLALGPVIFITMYTSYKDIFVEE